MIIVNSLFSFKPPKRVSSKEYFELKLFLTNYPDYDFLEKMSFYNERKGMILFVFITLPLSLIIMSLKKEGVNVAIGGLLMASSIVLAP